MEKWELEHPHLGALSAYVGWPEELHAIDPGFPVATTGPADLAKRLRRPASTQGSHKAADSAASEAPSPSDTANDHPEWSDRARDALNRNKSWGRQSVLLERDGAPFARFRSIGALKAPLEAELAEGSFNQKVTTKTKPYLEVQADPLGRHVNEILLHTDDEVLTFDSPVGSPAAKRHAAMESSAWKRALYPLLGGLGRSSSALVAIFLGPLIFRIGAAIISWILSFFPHFTLPSIPWPHINWPRIPLPHFNLPSIPWPHINLPPWAQWLLEHPKVWTPVLLAAFWGVTTARHRKKSQQKKAEWAARNTTSRRANNLPSATVDPSRGHGSTALSHLSRS